VSAAAEPAASREDLLTLIAVLREQNVVLAERCAGLEGQVTLLESQNEQLTVANERLTARVAELERRLDRNSKNSNFPPSQDVFGLPKDEAAAAKPKPAARRGKRKGAPGSGLAMVEHPDRVRDWRPTDLVDRSADRSGCQVVPCGASLGGAGAAKITAQQADIHSWEGAWVAVLRPFP